MFTLYIFFPQYLFHYFRDTLWPYKFLKYLLETITVSLVKGVAAFFSVLLSQVRALISLYVLHLIENLWVFIFILMSKARHISSVYRVSTQQNNYRHRKRKELTLCPVSSIVTCFSNIHQKSKLSKKKIQRVSQRNKRKNANGETRLRKIKTHQFEQEKGSSIWGN